MAATAYGSFPQSGALRAGFVEPGMDDLDWVRQRQITPLSQPRASSRQWSSSLTRFRDGRGSGNRSGSRQMRSTLGSKSEPMFRPPTSLFNRDGFDSAARLPAISTPGGFPTSGSLATSLYNTKKGTGAFGRTAMDTSMYNKIGGASSSTTQWPGSLDKTLLPAATSLSPRTEHNKSHLLEGVSSMAEKENARNSHSVDSLHLLPRNSNGQVQRSQRKRATTWQRPAEEMVDFAKTSTSIASTILELRTRHDNFQGGTCTAEGGKGKDAIITPQKREESKRQRSERLVEYKMVRKIEPELPPLARSDAVREAPLKYIEQEIVMRNTSSDAINVWLPEQRRKRRLDRKDIHDERCKAAAQMCEVLAENREKNAGKTRTALVVRPKDTSQALAGEQRREFVHQWATTICLTGFVQRAREELALRRMCTSDMLKYVEKHRDRLIGYGKESAFMKRAVQINADLKQPFLQSKFLCLVKMVQYKKAIATQRKRASTIFDFMKRMKHSGKIIISFNAFRKSVVDIQKWWQGVKKSLHEQRDQVAKRWMRIERAELMAEDKRKQEQQAKSEPAVLNSTRLKDAKLRAATERIIGKRMPVLDEATRLRFIESELRTMRYMLLPQIDLWKEDRRRWKAQIQDWGHVKEAHQVLGRSARSSCIGLFRWPPVRPSFMPPAHYRDHDQVAGRMCPESCPGRSGDSMILDMWKRARQSPDNYKRIPDLGAHKAKIPEQRARAGTDAVPQIGLYGPPPSTADQKRLGCMTDMPGVHIPAGSMSQLHEGQPKDWAAQMAAASRWGVLVEEAESKERKLT